MSSSSATMRYTGSLRYLLMVAVLAVVGASSVLADPIVFSNFIDPNDIHASGTISYAGGVAPLVGTGIGITDLVGPDGIDHQVVDGLMTFQTGNFLFVNANGNDVFDGDASSFIKLTGQVPDLGINTDQTLLRGAFIGAFFDPLFFNVTLQINLSGSLGIGEDFKNPTLLSAYGLPADQLFFFSSRISANPPVTPDPGTGAFTGDVLSAKVVNIPIPEPSSIVLCLTLMLGLAGTMRAAIKVR